MSERDSGRYDAITDTWIDQQIRIDFAWGNIPMQPNDDREEQLVYELDSHNIAVDGYRGFPEHIIGAPYDDNIPNTTVPNVVGMATYDAMLAAQAAGLSYSVVNDISLGATAENDDHVASQSPAAGTLVNVESNLEVVLYSYVSPVNHNISGIRKQFNGSTLDYNMFYMFLQGQNHNLFNGNTVNITGSDVDAYNKNGWIVLDAVNDNAFNTGGTKVTIFWNGVISETANGSGGTYTKN